MEGVQDEEAAQGEAPQEAKEEALGNFTVFSEWYRKVYQIVNYVSLTSN